MRAKEAGADPADFSSQQRAQRWLEGQPIGVAVTMAVRSALRVLPLLAYARSEDKFLDALVLPIFRAAAVAWAEARYPGRPAELHEAAYAAAAR